MARSIGTSLAVPDAALAASGNALAFEPAGWPHLGAYLAKVQALAAAGQELPADIRVSFDAVARLVAGFGAPGAAATPDGAAMPAQPYAGIVWLVKRLQVLAQDTRALLLTLRSGAGASERRAALASLMALAVAARDLGSPLLPQLQAFQDAIARANEDFSQAVSTLGQTLQARFEAVGAQQSRLRSLEDKLQHTSALHPLRRKELQAGIAAANRDLEAMGADAEQLRLQVAALQQAVDEGGWLGVTLGALLDFLQKLRAAWAAFGSGLTQLDAEAGDAQLRDAGWIGQQLMLDQAMPRWQALADAAGGFQAGPTPPVRVVRAQKVGI